MIEIKLDEKALLIFGLMILGFLPQIHLFFIFLIMDLVDLINGFIRILK